MRTIWSGFSGTSSRLSSASGSRFPKHETRVPKLDARNPSPETRYPIPESRYPNPETKKTETRIPKADTRNSDPEFESRSPELRLKGLGALRGTRLPKPDIRIRSLKRKIQGTEHAIRNMLPETLPWAEGTKTQTPPRNQPGESTKVVPVTLSLTKQRAEIHPKLQFFNPGPSTQNPNSATLNPKPQTPISLP